MSTDARMKFRIGVLVLGSLVLLALLIVLFGEFPNFLKGQIRYIVKLPQAPGVQEGTAVRKSGIRIGEVNSVELDSVSGEVTLYITVQKRYQLRQTDQAMLGRGLVLGDASLNFVPDAANPSGPAPDNFQFNGRMSDDIGKALTEARDIVPEIRKTLEEIRVAATSLNRTSETVDNLVRINQDKITQTIDNISRATARIGDLITPENQDRVAKIIKNVEEATTSLNGFLSTENRNNFTTTLKSVKDTSDRMASVLSDDNQKKLSAIIQDLKTTSERMTKVLSDENQQNFTASLQGIRTTTERLTKFLSEENEKNVSSTLQNLKTSSERIDGVTRNFDGAVTDARKAIKTLNDRVESTGNQVDATLTDTRKVIKNINDNVEIIGKDLQEAVKDGKATMKRLGESANRFDETVTSLRDVAKTINDRAPTILKNLEDGTAQLGVIAGNVGEFSKALAQGDGTIRRLVMDPSLYNRLNDGARALNGSLSRLEKIAKDVEVFADKIARHPEVLGLRGTVSPSSGLK